MKPSNGLSIIFLYQPSHFKQVPLCVTVLSVSANHKIAPSTVCVDKSAVIIVAVTQEHAALTGNLTAVLDLYCYLEYRNIWTEN